MQRRLDLNGRLPLFVFPSTVTFYQDDQTSHKQVITLYNPYEFPISFQVLCNAPTRYIVLDPQGTLRSQCCLDIVVRHTDVRRENLRAQDKLRIHVTEEGSQKVLGRKDIHAVLLPGVPEQNRANTEVETFQSLPARGAPTQPGTQQQQHPYTIGALHGGNQGPSVFIIVAAVVCLMALLLPTEGEKKQTSIPPHFHLSTSVKIVFAYILGLLTYAILRVG
ncbi:motile sperm domain-containing protein 1-like isoform X2 [Oratosquilla oratoria]